MSDHNNEGPTFTDPRLAAFVNKRWPEDYLVNGEVRLPAIDEIAEVRAQIAQLPTVARPGDDSTVEVTASVADSSLPPEPEEDPDSVDTVPNIPRITDHMRDPRDHDDEPTPAA